MNRVDKTIIIIFAIAALLLLCGGVLSENSQTAPQASVTPAVQPTREPITQLPLPTPTPTPAPASVYYTEDEIVVVAKVLYDECRGVGSDTEKACVVWTICNRVDAGYGSTISEVATAQGQFAYRGNAPVWDELYDLASDVLSRWNDERNGAVDVGRVLPSDYLWFSGWDGHNHFRNDYHAANGYWDYSLVSPYSS